MQKKVNLKYFFLQRYRCDGEFLLKKTNNKTYKNKTKQLTNTGFPVLGTVITFPTKLAIRFLIPYNIPYMLSLKLSAREPELLVQQPRVLVYGTVILLVVVTRSNTDFF